MKTLIRTIAILYIITAITAGISLAQVTSGTTTTSEPVEQADDAFAARVRTLGTSGLPERPVKRAGESDAQYNARLRAWDTEVRRLTLSHEFRTTTGTVQTDSYEQPVRRAGESDAAYQARIRNWEAELDKQNVSSQLLDLQKSLEFSRNTRSFNTFGNEPDNILVIPTEEMKTEELLTINEDMSVMSRILTNELNREINNSSKLEWYFSDGRWVPAYSSYNTLLGYGTNTLTSMYLQGYGVLFLFNVNFPLSAPPEAQKQPEEPDKEDIDSVWEQTRQQIYQPQVASTISTNTRGPDVKYDAQKIENLKTTLITALKHATNIRAMKPDDAVILRITGSNTSESSIQALLGDQYLIRKGNQTVWVKKEDIKFSISMTLVIRAKKSDIDTFAKGELDLEQFRQRVQIISYPLLQNALPSTTTGRTSVPFGTTGTRATTSGTTTSTTSPWKTSRTTVAPPIKPANETED
jgi:hypothetical protein